MQPEPVKILVVDDSEDDWFLYRRALRSDNGNGYTILEVNNGEDGLQYIAQNEPACVLLDYSLPGRNGIEVLKCIRAKHPFVAVVMLTGQGNEQVAVHAMRERAQNYISKASITPENLQRAIRIAIEHCAMERRIHEQRTSLEIFTRALAHDLKEPVRTIRSFLDVLGRQEELSPKAQKYFDYIHQAAERMAGLIDTVYMYTRLDSGGRRVPQENCDSNQALEDAKSNLDMLIKERKAQISSDALPKVYINRMHLIQLLQNLLGNAIHHGGEAPAIHVSARQQGKEWLFLMRDNGPGVSEEYRQKIFEPFKRLSHNKEQGLGLGLAICKKIVESCDGKIWCDAVEGGGADFMFTLPAPPEVVSGETSVAVMSRKNGGDANAALANVMLVEDNEADVELMRIMLLEENNLQCNIYIAHDGQEALNLLVECADKQNPIDLVFLDINMPGMDGFELLEHMRDEAKLRKTQVVMCSTSTYDKDVSRAKSLGAVGYIAKPADFNSLKPLIGEMPNLNLCQGIGSYSLMRAA